MVADCNDLAKLHTWLLHKLLEERCASEARHIALIEDLKLQSLHVASNQTGVELVGAQAFLEKHEGSPEIVGDKRWDNDGPMDFAAVSSSEALARRLDRAAQASSKPLTQKSGSVASLIKTTSSELVDNASFIQRVVHSHTFEVFSAVVISMNLVVMIVEQQYDGLGKGYQINYPKFRLPKDELWPGADLVFAVIDYIFAVLYSIEIAFKILALRWKYCNVWNMLDSLIVLLWYGEKLLSASRYTFMLPVDAALFRIFRLLRLLRLVRLAKKMVGFDQLVLLYTALKGCISILGWTFMVLIFCQLSIALFVNQVFGSYYIENENVPLDAKHTAFKYFGTFGRTCFSMFELILANWIPISRFLMEDVDECMVVLALAYKLTFGFAIVAVINGCFIKETFKVVDSDDFLMVLSKEKEARLHMQKMKKFLEVADESGEGCLDFEEFCYAVKQPDVKAWLSAQGLDASNPTQIFAMIKAHVGGGETLGIDELVKGVKWLKGPARSLDLFDHTGAAAIREKRILQEVQSVATREHLILTQVQEIRNQLRKIESHSDSIPI